MNCPHCGNLISPADRLCPNCGADLGVEETIISRTPPPLSDIPTPEGAEETIISRMPPPTHPPPPPPGYEPPPAPPTYPSAPSPPGEMGGRSTVAIVAVVLILLCCCCLIAVVLTYMLLSEGDLGEILQISWALSLV